MTPGARRTLLGLAMGAAALFGGREIADLLAERWWAEIAAPQGAALTIRWALLRSGLEAGAMALGIAWFGFHLLLAVRLGGRAARGEDRRSLPVLPASATRWWAAGVAVLLGVLCGSGAGAWARDVALAVQTPRWGIADPVHGLDVGFHLALLPVLGHLQSLALALTLLGFIATLMLYAVSGSLRVAARAFTLDPRIRLHLGLLGAAVGLALGAGYLLEPLELVAGVRPALGAAHAALLTTLARIMTGFAVAVTVLTALWGVRGRMMVPVGAWASFALFGLAIRLLAPASGTAGDPSRPAAEQRDLDREAFALPPLLDLPLRSLGLPPARDRAPIYWDPGTIAGSWIAAQRLADGPDAIPSPGLLLVRRRDSAPGLEVTLIADREVTPAGGPLSWRPSADGAEASPGIWTWRDLPRSIHYPGAVGVARTEGTGVARGGTIRRLLLSWSLQENLFRGTPDDLLAWRRDPRERLGALVPFAEWGTPSPAWLDGRLHWLAPGYLFATGFPGVAPVPWRGHGVSYLRAGLLGLVDSESGLVRIFERGAGDPVTGAWVAVARGLVEPAQALPVAARHQAGYPWELFVVQSRVLQRSQWGIGGHEAPHGDSLGGARRELPVMDPAGRRVTALLEAESRDGTDQLRLLRLDSLESLDDPRVIAERWQRLPFVVQMADSIRRASLRLELGRVQLQATGEGLVAIQVGHARDSLGRASLGLVNLAQGSRMGTGPGLALAWANLQGEVAALPFTVGPEGQLREARGWLLRADSAFRRGDLAGFARAFDALRAILDYPPGPPKF